METRQEELGYSTSIINNYKPTIDSFLAQDKKTTKDIVVKKERITYKIIKRIFDFIGGIIGAIFLLPLTLIVYVGNVVSKDNGPVFYVQKRIGKNGKFFKIYKFRTMVVGADKKLRKYLQENPEDAREYEKYKKLQNDPRITKWGAFLRKTSIDEFPQFINVLKGEMSIVGPRPYLTKEKKDMGESYRTIIKCKPGITCIWQISGRNNLSFNERLNLDEEYVSKKNLIVDLKILLKTVIKVFKSEGAV